jgi:hypothetical protein
MLLDVVGGAFLERCLVERAAPEAGNQDEGLSMPCLFRFANQVDAVAVRQPMIDKIHVVRAGLDSPESHGGARNDVDVTFEMRFHERHFNERFRLRIVVNHKDAQMAEITAAPDFRFLDRVCHDHRFRLLRHV